MKFLAVHQFFDQTKAAHADFRHRAILHNTFGIFLCEQVFGPTIPVTVAHQCSVCGDRLKVKEDGAVPARAKHEEECETEDFAPIVKQIPTRWIGEQHVIEDMGRIVPLSEWIECIRPADWMNRPQKLSRELDREDRQREREETPAWAGT